MPSFLLFLLIFPVLINIHVYVYKFSIVSILYILLFYLDDWLYQFSYNLIENKIRKLSELTIDNSNELKNVIRFDDLNTFYNNYKKIKIRIE